MATNLKTTKKLAVEELIGEVNNWLSDTNIGLHHNDENVLAVTRLIMEERRHEELLQAIHEIQEGKRYRAMR